MNNKYLTQYIPEKFDFLLKSKIIKYKEVNLKTSYLINIINELILKYYFTNKNYLDISPTDDIKFNLWSSILRKKYGMHYNLYMDYLINIGFLDMISNYYVGKKSKTYKINQFEFNSIKRVQISDNILLKKSSKEYLMRSITNFCNSPIKPDIRKKLVDDLYKVQIDYDKSMSFIENLKNSGNIEVNKYYKNIHSIESIKNKSLFFKFDEYGRFHTNFTILKKEIRQKYLKINNEEINEIDIGNSQPLFLSILIKNELSENDPDISNYIWLVKQGLFYEYIISKFPSLTRKDAKLLTYKVLFGHNGINSTDNKIFESLFPKVYNFIIDYKSINEDYKSLSHVLQKMESDFIYGKVVKEIYAKIKNINLITIHDSIIYPIKYDNEIKEIFNRHKSKIFD